MPADTIPARLLDQARRRPNAPAYHVREAGTWQPTSWAAYADQVRRVARALIALGFERGQVVCILGFNRPEWAIADLAAMTAGGAAAGIYTTCSPEEVRYVVDHSEAPVVVVENAEQYAKIKKERAHMPHLRHVVVMRGAKVDDPGAITWEQLLAKAEAVPESEVDGRVNGLRDEDLATLIYTSGTTGPPKAVMLSHRNLAWTAGAAREIVDTSVDDRNISYLPLSHIAEQMFTLHVPITVGSQVYFAESMEKLRDNAVEVQPTVFFGVPRVWEKFHAGVQAKLGELTGAKKRIAQWAKGVASRVSAKKCRGEPAGPILGAQYALAKRLVLDNVKKALGLGDVRYAVSGAAPIGPEVLQFFASLDIVILEVYGQSEDTGPTSFNQPGRTKLGSVGPSVPGVEVKIAEDGEILVRGPNVFLGYYKDPAATNETLKDGWLCSGDLGQFDADGFLHITGRKKEIIITAGGKNIAPKNIEAELKNHPLIAEAVVIGDRRRFLSALLVLDDEVAKRWAAERGLATGTDLRAHPDVQAEIQRAVDASNEKFARVEWVRKWRLLPRPLTIADGELTPTLKVKRRKVEDHFKGLLDEIYAEDVAA